MAHSPVRCLVGGRKRAISPSGSMLRRSARQPRLDAGAPLRKPKADRIR
jgi:hypothetical protein